MLDIAHGRPAAGVAIELLRGDEVLATAVTNADGRTDAPLLERLEAGDLRAALRRRRLLRDRRRAAVPRRRAGPLRRQRPRRAPPRAAAGRARRLQHVPRELRSARQVVARCRELARISEEEGRLTRWFGGPAMARANALVGALDGGGRDGGARSTPPATSSATCPGSDPDAGTLLLGSHLDTVRDAGAFDGPLGVLAAIECVARLRAQEVEPAVRRRRARLRRRGGPALRHRLPRQPRRRGDARPRDARPGRRGRRDGARGARRVRRRPGRDRGASRRGERLLGYCELHIEQGPVLERARAPRRHRDRDRRRDARRGRASPGGPGTRARCRWSCAATRACAAGRVRARGRGRGAGRAGAGRDGRPAGGAARRAERDPRRARWPRSTSATPTTPCAPQPSARCARRAARSRRRAGSRSRGSRGWRRPRWRWTRA